VTGNNSSGLSGQAGYQLPSNYVNSPKYAVNPRGYRLFEDKRYSLDKVGIRANGAGSGSGNSGAQGGEDPSIRASGIYNSKSEFYLQMPDLS
jgi:hypothetical protein